jgi:hypothetical protein
MTERKPKPSQNWSEYLSDGIPPGDDCTGCDWIEDGMCLIFDEPCTWGKVPECRDNKWLRRD